MCDERESDERGWSGRESDERGWSGRESDERECDEKFERRWEEDGERYRKH